LCCNETFISIPQFHNTPSFLSPVGNFVQKNDYFPYEDKVKRMAFHLVISNNYFSWIYFEQEGNSIKLFMESVVASLRFLVKKDTKSVQKKRQQDREN